MVMTATILKPASTSARRLYKLKSSVPKNTIGWWLIPEVGVVFDISFVVERIELALVV